MTYASAVLADAPWGWWRLTESPGGVSANLDSSGNGRTMSLTGTWTAAVTGPIDRAISFDQVSGGSGRSDAALTRPTVGTWETWVKITGANPSGALPLCVAAPLTGGNGLSPGLILNTNGSVGFSVYTGSTSLISSSVLAVGWHHAAGTVGAAGQFLYIDGVQVATAAVTAGLNIADSVRIAIHSANLSTNIGAVSIAEPAFYTTQLSADRILAHYGSGMPGMIGALRGTSTPPVFTATLAGALSPLTVQVSGTSTPPQFNGVLNAGLPALTATFASGYTPPPIDGALQATMRALGGNLTGTVLPPPVTATLDAPLPSAPFVMSTKGTSKPLTGGARWTLHDPKSNETYVFPHNPNKMTTPHSPRNFNVIATAPSGALTGGSRGGMGRVVELARDPFEWTFSGRIKTQAQYDELLHWANKPYRVQLSDHFGRTWSIRALAFNPNELIPTPRIPWRYEYDFKALNYGLAT